MGLLLVLKWDLSGASAWCSSPLQGAGCSSSDLGTLSNKQQTQVMGSLGCDHMRECMPVYTHVYGPLSTALPVSDSSDTISLSPVHTAPPCSHP